MADPTAVEILINGQRVTRFARVHRVRIDDVLNDAPNTAALSVVYTARSGGPQTAAFHPPSFDNAAFQTRTENVTLTPPPITPGHAIAIYLGTIDTAHQIFGGQITAREQYAAFDQPEHVRFDLQCVDYTRRLNRRKVLKAYTAQSATAIVLDLLATFAPTITGANVMAGLPTITGGITFTFEEMSRALSRVAEKIGAYWYVDYAGDLHFFTGNEAGTDPAPIVPGADFAKLKITADLTQVRTRVLVEGDGATALVTLPAGDSTLPISVVQPFNAAGGRAKVNESRVTYTGIQAGGVKVNTVGTGTGSTPPPTAPAAPSAAVSGAAGNLAGGPYQYAATVELSDGSRSDLGLSSNSVSIPAANAPGGTSASLVGPPIKGPIAVGVSSVYAQSFVSSRGETPATTGGSSLTGAAVGAPGGMGPSTQTTGGQIVPGYYFWAYTYYTPAGETLVYQTPISGGVAAGYSAVLFSGLPPASDTRVIGRRLYRSSVSQNNQAGPVLPWRLVTTIPSNADYLTFTDTMADANLAPVSLPIVNSATDVGQAAVVTLQTSGDARVTRRRLSRKDGAGEFRLIAEIPNNTATSYTDTLIGSGSGTLAPTVNTLNTGAVQVSSIPLGPATTVRRRVFRTSAGGSQMRELVSLGDNTTTTYLDTEADSALGGSPLPSQGGPGASAPPTAIGSPTLQISDLSGLPSSGWVAVESMLVRYTGTSTSGGNFLTGIPASGPGAITAAIPAGTVVSSSPALVGVSPVVAVTLGDAVQLLAQVDDVPAQTAMAAVEGGDGIIEHYIQDRRLSEAGAIARGTAELTLFKQIETQVTYTTHDPNTRSGRTVHMDLPAPTNLVGDFLIQKVTIDDVSIAKNWYPKRTVEASTTRFSFDDVLSRLLMEQT
jgi:hypothetical protein